MRTLKLSSDQPTIVKDHFRHLGQFVEQIMTPKGHPDKFFHMVAISDREVFSKIQEVNRPHFKKRHGADFMVACPRQEQGRSVLEVAARVFLLRHVWSGGRDSVPH
jgi:hypothetical protein